MQKGICIPTVNFSSGFRAIDFFPRFPQMIFSAFLITIVRVSLCLTWFSLRLSHKCCYKATNTMQTIYGPFHTTFSRWTYKHGVFVDCS